MTCGTWKTGVGGVLLMMALMCAGCQREATPENPAPAPDWVARVPAAPEGDRLPAAFYPAARHAHDAAVAAGGDLEPLQAYATLLHASGFFAEAATGWAILVEQQPAEAHWPYFIADAYRNLGYEAEAQEWLQRALALDLTYRPGWLRAGDFQLKRGDWADARASYARVLAIDPGDLHGRLGLARVEAREGETAAAIDRLRAVAEEAPNFGTAMTVLAELLEQQGEAREAAQWRRRAAGTPRYFEAEDPWLGALYAQSYDPARLVLWGNYASFAGRTEEAVRFYRLAMERAPEQSASYQFLGDLLAKQGAHAEAVAVLQRGVGLADASEAMVVRLVESLMLLQRLDEARAAAEQGLARWGESALVENALGRVLALQGETAAAVAAFDRAMAWLPHYADPALNQAMVHLQTGARAAAEASLDEALRRQPAFPRARVLQAQMAMADGDLMGALDHLQAAYEQSPGVADVRRALARWFETAIAERLTAGDRATAERLARQGGTLLPEVAESLRAQADAAR